MAPSTPLVNTFLCKVASRCNLDCDYCYMYHHADQSWRDRPRFMSDETVAAFARNLADYIGSTKLDAVTVLLHGGEPLLAGEERIIRFCGTVRKALEPQGTSVEFAMQTNGVLLSPRWMEALGSLGITFGVSLDGDRAANDRHRFDHGRGSSHADVERGLRVVQASSHRHLFRGFLSVMDVENDPLETYRYLLSWEPPRLDFLLPEGTHEKPPPGIPGGGDATRKPTPYADWLIPIFDEWFSHPGQTGIRLFENLIDVLLGGRSQTDGTGEGSFNLFTIETDGAVEDVDLFKAAYPGAPGLGLPSQLPPNVFTTPFADLTSWPTVIERHRLNMKEGLCQTCQACPAVEACGGGFVPHRWSVVNGFSNPSVYCADLYKLCAHVNHALGVALKPLLVGKKPVVSANGAFGG
jgi:uncharacterized protein